MIRLRLFPADDPSRQIDARMIGADAVTIGRDTSADWVIADPERALSRKHCSVRSSEAGLFVRDTSANGTFVGDGGERITPNAETLVKSGDALRIGNYRLVVEALAADPPPQVALRPTPAPTPSLFAPPRGLDPVDAPARPARVDPFASQLAPDPLLGDHRAPGSRGGLIDHDAWDNRPAARAGDWDVPAGRGHEDLIGTPRAWSEPPRPERDGGYGFDAPFGRPMLAPVSASPADVAIPADWDAGLASAAPTPPAPVRPIPVLAPAPPVAVPPLAAPSIAAPTVATATPAIPPTPIPAPVAPPSLAPSIVDAILSRPAAPPIASPVYFDPPPPAVADALPILSPAAPVAPPAMPVAAPVVPASIAAVPAAPAPFPAASATPPQNDAMLFEAFCAGAHLSPASFAGEDRAAAMTRLGEIYRVMVLGLADLMGERTALKNEYRMTRTMVRPEGNNPFKWAPPQRLAIEVLRGGEAGFANGAAAVNEGFRDVKIHILCMLAGLRAAIAATMEALSPAQAEAGLGGKSYLIKAQREAALWQEYVERFERFRLDADDSADGPINRAFRAAYERQLGELLGAQAGYDGGPAPAARR